MTVIYYVLSTEGEDPCVCITPKDFWDRNHCMSDEHDEKLFNFMENATEGEMCTNMFALNNVADIKNLNAKAREACYDFQINDAFTAFMRT